MAASTSRRPYRRYDCLTGGSMPLEKVVKALVARERPGYAFTREQPR